MMKGFFNCFKWFYVSHKGGGGVLSLSAVRQAGQLHFPVLASSLHLKCWSVFTHMLYFYVYVRTYVTFLTTPFKYLFLKSLCVFLSFSAHFEAKEAGDMSTLFDVGGIVGKI